MGNKFIAECWVQSATEMDLRVLFITFRITKKLVTRASGASAPQPKISVGKHQWGTQENLGEIWRGKDTGGVMALGSNYRLISLGGSEGREFLKKNCPGGRE